MTTLNEDQQKAADEFFEFLMSRDKEYSISGPPGVGKTFTLQHLVSDILPIYKRACQLLDIPPTINRVALCATTNRAAEVLSGAMNLTAQTVHSFLNLTVVPNFKTGKDEIRKTKKFFTRSHTLIICDEASMIDRELYAYMHEATDDTCKIVYVGDHAQLAPVGESLSLVFSKPTIQTSRLTKPVRNAGQPALVALCQQLRSTVEGGPFLPIAPVPDVIEYPTNEEMQDHINTVFAEEGADSRILAYTNDQVIKYNTYIRQLRGYGPLLEEGELVVNNSAVSLAGDVVLSAELELRVVKVRPEPQQKVFGTGETAVEVMHYDIIVENPKTGDQYLLHQAMDSEYLKQVKKYVAKLKNWPVHYLLKDSFPDLRARDASTVYKAQGSTFETVYVDLQNIGTCHQPNQVARMLYVAISRARSKVYLYGRLPAKYGG